ncbi:hypothetical protein H6G20_11605 [Desertifilum sp. FACHB-1129]|uniref:Uncharacterized protein n=1 Tax=Desertifilum tharense IPPAS B-1220 TaxID=1781255 RepID=A0ACD5GTG0_9CYAN|nr:MULTISPECIES: hypothetical protein [Desertifilum]MCD8489478.1 hypothetical protein [Desertifilum sp.]MDA0210820.1 hypothetical protein [Cyanobacteria bacterium FC1]MBD2312307.1 hypothetical protein [Desertifilum sp. FACHB-1129]MBD2323626.1 hypothetical protein [Desertifilum sp. FACHB-866]MBD2332323.1 hypothetical protein [Desertifilum sp. FACHB-868]
MESPIFTGLAVVAFGLMVVVSGGILYLTAAEWRDRRRRDREQRER